jgi:hypothetical protein
MSPVYEYICPKHGRYETYKQLREFSRVDECPDCGASAIFVLSKPGKHIVDFTSGWNGGAGKEFNTKKDREVWMREHNAVRA